jgi:hypothetical protein
MARISIHNDCHFPDLKPRQIAFSERLSGNKAFITDIEQVQIEEKLYTLR